tara:strand:+ start:280 stop:480 length:201 start_codon:yes stop_codon:yes gene_type:complete
VSGCGLLSADGVTKLANSIEEFAVDLAFVAVEVSVLDVRANSVEEIGLIQEADLNGVVLALDRDGG